jgi:Ca-activated chloride channel family protein
MPTARLLCVTLFALLALCAAAPCAAQTPATVTVVNKKTGAPVTGLTREAFGLSDGKMSQELTSFVGADEPSSVAIVLDLSGSVRAGDPLKRLRDTLDALSRLIRSGHPSNEYMVITFAEEVVTVLDASRGTDAAAEALLTLPGAKPGTQSSLFDACWQTINKLAGGAHAKRSLILVTDGDDTYSRAREDDVVRQLKEMNVVIYGVNVGEDDGRETASGNPLDVGTRLLEKLSKVSGGLSFNARDEKTVRRAVEQIAAELRGQYVVGFKPSAPPAPGKCLKLKTSVTPPAADAKDLIVRTREEFCAPRADLRKK